MLDKVIRQAGELQNIISVSIDMAELRREQEEIVAINILNCRKSNAMWYAWLDVLVDFVVATRPLIPLSEYLRWY